MLYNIDLCFFHTDPGRYFSVKTLRSVTSAYYIHQIRVVYEKQTIDQRARFGKAFYADSYIWSSIVYPTVYTLYISRIFRMTPIIFVCIRVNVLRVRICALLLSF